MRSLSSLFLLVTFAVMAFLPSSTFGQTKEEKERQKKMELLQKLRDEKAKVEANAAKSSAKVEEKTDVSVAELITRYETYLASNCAKGVQNARCADMMYSLAGAYYKKGQDDFIQNTLAYEKKMAAYQANPIGKEPISPIPSYDKSLNLYKEAVKQYPHFTKAAEGYYQIGSIELLNGNLVMSRAAYEQLVKQYPSSYRSSAAHFRISEICFSERDYACAMTNLNAMVDEHLTADIKEMAHFRKAEIFYNQGAFDQAALWFGTYIEKCDRLEFPKRELRPEALEYMSVCFSDMENGADEAIKYFEVRGRRAYEDTVIYSVGMKNYDHGQYEQAIKALGRAIEKFPNYMGAPAAQTNIVYSHVIRRKHEEANKAREMLVDNYGKNSNWQKLYASNAKALAKANDEVQKALGSIAIYFHAAAQVSKEPAVQADLYSKALRRYVQFIDSYPEEKWKVYEFKYNVAEAYFTLKDYENAAACYDFVASADLKTYPKFKDDVDTVGMDTKEIEQARAAAAKNSPVQISQMEAGFNAIVAMDSLRVAKIKVGNLNDVQAYALPETKKFIEYIHAFQGRFPKSEYASEILFLAADVQFKGGDYRGAITESQSILSAYGKKNGLTDTVTVKRATKILADAYSKNEQFDLAVTNYDALLVFEVASTPEYKNIIDLAAAAIFRKGEKFRTDKSFALAEKEFKRIYEKYPASTVADKGWFEAAVSREKDSSWSIAAATFSELPTKFPASALRQTAFVRSGENYAKALMWPQAGEIMLASAKAFKSEPAFAVGALAKASEYYKSGKDLVKSADMFFLIYEQFPTDSTAPTALYNAGLMYEEAKAYDRAIVTYKALGTKYSNSASASDAYFSIGLVYEKMGKTEEMAVAFVDFAQKFTANKSSQLKALIKAADAYKKLGNQKKVEEVSLLAVDVYDKNKKKDMLDGEDGAKAFYTLADVYRSKFEAISLDGKTQKDVDKQLKAKVEALKPVIENYTEAIKEQVAEWTIKSTYSIGLTYRNYVNTVRTQKLFGDETKRLGTQIQILSGDIQKGYDEAIAKFARSIEFARLNGVTEKYVDTAEVYLMETWYNKGYAYEEAGEILRNSPIPDDMSDEEQMAYLDALEEYYSKYVEQALPIYEAAVEHAIAMEVGKNEWTVKIQEHAKLIAAYYNVETEASSVDLDAKKSAALAARGPVVDPIEQKVAKELEAAIASISAVATAELPFDQKKQRISEIQKSTEREIATERAKIEELKNKLGKVN